MNTELKVPELNLHAAGMLCYVQVRLWSARKLDKSQTAKTNKAAKASADASRVNKHLLVDADAALKMVARKGNEIRTFIDSQTLPWDNAGYRLLDNARAITVVGDVNNLVQEFNALVDSFVDEYPVLRAKALSHLGDMANDDDYPRPDQVRAKFGVDITFQPIPHTFGGRYGMADAVAAIWENNYVNTVAKQQQAAIKSAMERLRENLQRYSERLTLTDKGTPGRFTDTMVQQLRDTVDLIESLSLYESEDMRLLIAEVRNDIARRDPADLRSSVSAAVEAKQDADYVLRRMQELLG